MFESCPWEIHQDKFNIYVPDLALKFFRIYVYDLDEFGDWFDSCIFLEFGFLVWIDRERDMMFLDWIQGYQVVWLIGYWCLLLVIGYWCFQLFVPNK